MFNSTPLNGLPHRNRYANASFVNISLDGSFVSPNKKNNMSPMRRYALSDTTAILPPSPSMLTPKLTRTQIDTKSAGYASRLVSYSDESERSMPLHQPQYNGPGIFPIVHMFKRDLPTLKRTPARTSLRSVDLARYNSPEHNRMLLEQIVQPNSPSKMTPIHPSNPEISTRSVLDALKEISRKRIHANEEDFDLSMDEGKRIRLGQMNGSAENVNRKRGRKASPSQTDPQISPRARPRSKKLCQMTLDELKASHTSTLDYAPENVIAPVVKETTTTQVKEPVVEQSPKIVADAGTQTIETKEVSKTRENPADGQQIVKIFDDKILEVRRKNRLAVLMRMFVDKDKPEQKTISPEKPLVSILTDSKQKNVQKITADKHVTFNVPSNSEISDVGQVGTTVPAITTTSVALATPITTPAVIPSAEIQVPPSLTASSVNTVPAPTFNFSPPKITTTVAVATPNVSTVSALEFGHSAASKPTTASGSDGGKPSFIHTDLWKPSPPIPVDVQKSQPVDSNPTLKKAGGFQFDMANPNASTAFNNLPSRYPYSDATTVASNTNKPNAVGTMNFANSTPPNDPKPMTFGSTTVPSSNQPSIVISTPQASSFSTPTTVTGFGMGQQQVSVAPPTFNFGSLPAASVNSNPTASANMFGMTVRSNVTTTTSNMATVSSPTSIGPFAAIPSANGAHVSGAGSSHNKMFSFGSAASTVPATTTPSVFGSNAKSLFGVATTTAASSMFRATTTTSSMFAPAPAANIFGSAAPPPGLPTGGVAKNLDSSVGFNFGGGNAGQKPRGIFPSQTASPFASSANGGGFGANINQPPPTFGSTSGSFASAAITTTVPSGFGTTSAFSAPAAVAPTTTSAIAFGAPVNFSSPSSGATRPIPNAFVVPITTSSTSTVSGFGSSVAKGFGSNNSAGFNGGDFGGGANTSTFASSAFATHPTVPTCAQSSFGGGNSGFGFSTPTNRSFGNSFGTNSSATAAPPPTGGIFNFGSASNVNNNMNAVANATNNQPSIFSFGSSEPAKTNFNFNNAPDGFGTASINTSSTSSVFGGSGGGFGSTIQTPPNQFGQPLAPPPGGAPGMFNIGSGTSTPARARTQLKAKRRT